MVNTHLCCEQNNFDENRKRYDSCDYYQFIDLLFYQLMLSNLVYFNVYAIDTAQIFSKEEVSFLIKY